MQLIGTTWRAARVAFGIALGDLRFTYIAPGLVRLQGLHGVRFLILALHVPRTNVTAVGLTVWEVCGRACAFSVFVARRVTSLFCVTNGDIYIYIHMWKVLGRPEPSLPTVWGRGWSSDRGLKPT